MSSSIFNIHIWLPEGIALFSHRQRHPSGLSTIFSVVPHFGSCLLRRAPSKLVVVVSVFSLYLVSTYLNHVEVKWLNHLKMAWTWNCEITKLQHVRLETENRAVIIQGRMSMVHVVTWTCTSKCQIGQARLQSWKLQEYMPYCWPNITNDGSWCQVVQSLSKHDKAKSSWFIDEQNWNS